MSRRSAATVDGYDAVYVDDSKVPAIVETHPRYPYNDGYPYYGHENAYP